MAEAGNPELDLFGEPVVAPREGPGRPEAVWSREGSNRALLAFAAGKTVQFAAKIVGLSVPTFRKVYFSECAKRKLAADKFEFQQLAVLAEQANEGKVGASKELDRRLDRIRLRDQAQRLPAERTAKANAERKGKKEEQRDAAKGVAGRYGARTPPPLLMN